MPNFPLIVGHRGWPTRFPDNTLAAFMASAWVSDQLEMDVRRSHDGKLVLAHDAVIGGHVVSETRWAVLAQIDLGGGHRPAHLDEVLVAVPGTPVQIEIKNMPFEPGYEPDHRLALEAADRVRPGDVISSFNAATLAAVRSAYPEVPTMLAVEPLVTIEEAVRQCREMGCVGLVPRETMIDRPIDSIDDLAIYPWTVNDPERAIELAEFGVSGIITDDPGSMRDRFESER